MKKNMDLKEVNDYLGITDNIDYMGRAKIIADFRLLEKLINNIDGAEIILKDDAIAKELLPCQSGFFFGSTEYDEWYLKDIEYTINTINEILKEEEELNKLGFYSDFEYRASW